MYLKVDCEEDLTKAMKSKKKTAYALLKWLYPEMIQVRNCFSLDANMLLPMAAHLRITKMRNIYEHYSYLFLFSYVILSICSHSIKYIRKLPVTISCSVDTEQQYCYRRLMSNMPFNIWPLQTWRSSSHIQL